MKRSQAASTPVLLRVSQVPKASLREDSGSDGAETESDYSDEQSDSSVRDDGLDVSDDDEFEDFYHGGKRRGRGGGAKGGKKGLGESSMPVDDMEGEATYASSAIAGMFGNVDDEEAEEERNGKGNGKKGGNDEKAINGQRKKRLETLLSKTDKIVNRLNAAMKESMSNVMAAAAEANKADMDMKRKMEEEADQQQRQLQEKEDKEGDDEEKGPSPVKTRKKAAAAAAAAAAITDSTEIVSAKVDDEPVAVEISAAAAKAEKTEKKFLKEGSLRDYQLGGVEWLGALHEQGLNGILADEMGLGKTLQVLTFLYELHERHRLWGPHLVVMPMSVLSSWKSEVKRFLPDTFDVYVHHGPKDTRADDFADWRRRMVATRKARIAAMNSASTTTLGSVLKGTLAQASGEEKGDAKPQGPQSICICLTTYDIALKDQALLQRFGRSACRWGYLVVDEAHRLKNRSSLLFEALAKVNASRRLLLSGTPLQNNLGELWSLLSFTLPEIFNDIQHFVEWFNRPFEQDSDDEGSSSADKQKGGKSKGKGSKVQRKSFKGSKGAGGGKGAGRLNSTIQDSLSEEERSLIVSSLHRIMKPFLLRRLKRDVMTELPEKLERTIVCPRSALQKALYEVIRSSVESAEGAGAGSGNNWKSPTEHLQPAKADLLRRNGRLQLQGKPSDNGEGQGEGGAEEEDENALFDALEDHASRIFSSGVSFNNVLMHLRKLCNHPYLLLEDMSSIPDDLYYRYLVSASGKMCVLERLVQSLIPNGHKIIVFSQFTSTMDILQGFLHNLGIASFRLDGSTPRETRESDISEFMSPDPQDYVPGSADGGSSVGRVPVFLLSTRAGGVGINLQAADTVIFFDSDWNPQQDLQAMSRAHRLGQRETVLVIRLVTCGETSDDGYYYPSAEQRILKAAAHKLAAERIVLADGEFDMGTSGAGAGGASGKAAKAMQRENKQLTEALVQDGGIMALFAKESGGGERLAHAPADADDKLAVSPAAAASVRARSDGMRALEAAYLLETTNRGAGLGEELSPRSSSTSLDALAGNSTTSSSSSPDTDKADSSADSSRDVLELSVAGVAVAPVPPPTELLHELNYDQVRDWAPWLGVPPAFEERVREEKAHRQRERKAELEKLKRERQEEAARLKAERAAKSAALHKKAVAAREREEEKVRERALRLSSASSTTSGAKTERGWKRKLGRKVHSPNLNEDRLWEGALDAAEDEASLSEVKKRKGRPAGVGAVTEAVPMVLDEEDICVLCGEAWVAAAITKIHRKEKEDKDEEEAMTDKEREQVMLLCDGCSGSYHMVCVGCFEVPEGDWYCAFCESSRHMEGSEEDEG